MRVFLDTNVLASALATRGLCADILREVMAKHELIVSEPLLKELKRVLPRKFKIPTGLAVEMIDFFKQDLAHVDHDLVLDIGIEDKDDIVILSSAISRKTDIFVTGDKEVQALGRLEEMKIVSPRTFWDTRNKLMRA
jgi:putative PIN family toxin of toxin-antitoxin system